MIIKYDDQETRTNIFSMMSKKVELWLQKNKIEYKIIKEHDIPDEWEHGCTYQGKTFMKHYCCVVSKLNSEWFLQVVDLIGNMTEEEFKGFVS